MKYFIMRSSPYLANSFQISGWEDKINRKWICREELYKIPQRVLLPIKIKEGMAYPDVVTSPFLLVSDLVYKIIRLYGDSVCAREVIFVDSEAHINKRYYLVVIEDIESGNTPLKERNLFYKRINEKSEVIVSLDFAESILRRDAIGIHLEEITLSEFMKEG